MQRRNLFLLPALALPALARPGLAQEVVVGVSLSSDTNPFYIAMRRGMEARANELGWRTRFVT
ncbi:MAG: hypothetical protein EBY30_15395, partial [Rhodospirillales bacterium]|nr:hypothetical protein [Rhodospirillales bacterium]